MVDPVKLTKILHISLFRFSGLARTLDKGAGGEPGTGGNPGMSDESQRTNDHGRDAGAGDVEDAEENPLAKMDKASAQNVADMERVTDFQEEKEFGGTGNASAMLSNVASEQAKSSTGPVVITLRKADIDALVEHFDVKRFFAERLLKKHLGDMRKAVRELMYGGQTAPAFSSSLLSAATQSKS